MPFTTSDLYTSIRRKAQIALNYSLFRGTTTIGIHCLSRTCSYRTRATCPSTKLNPTPSLTLLLGIITSASPTAFLFTIVASKVIGTSSGDLTVRVSNADAFLFIAKPNSNVFQTCSGHSKSSGFTFDETAFIQTSAGGRVSSQSEAYISIPSECPFNRVSESSYFALRDCRNIERTNDPRMPQKQNPPTGSKTQRSCRELGLGVDEVEVGTGSIGLTAYCNNENGHKGASSLVQTRIVL